MAHYDADSLAQSELEKTWGKLLVQHGFIIAEDETGANVRKNYRYDFDKKLWKPVEGAAIDHNHALMEYAEDVLINGPYQKSGADYVPTGYPAPLKRYHILYESPNLSIEEVYFWNIDHLRYDQGFMHAHKIRDVFTATENSAFFGSSQQRLGIQQDKVQQYLATIGKMVKDLFQIVREVRIIDEKLHPRREWTTSKSADITLKSEYVDLVENRGGQTSPGSVYGLAQQLGYATLPDLFFNTHVYELKEVDRVVDRLDFNKNVKAVLKRKLYQYINWKLKTDHELESRRVFTLKYLRQHWDVIEMYMNWIKPYLRHIARLQMNEERLDGIDMVGAFEQGYIEVEVLFAKPEVLKRKDYEVILLTINYRTRPQMNFVQEGYQKGPIHVGQADIYWRGYRWTKDHIDAYIRYRRQEDLYMLGVVDRSVRDAMEALGEELEKYLAEAGEPKYREKVEAEKKAEEARRRKEAPPSIISGLAEPFTALGRGFGEMLGIGSLKGLFNLDVAKKKQESPPAFYRSIYEEGSLGGNLKAQLYQTVKNFKKGHGMLSWG